MKTTNIYLIRHGEPEASSRGRCYGKLDYGLSPKGEAQIKRDLAYFEKVQLETIITSPRRRASESARIIAEARGLEALIEPDFAEINFGLLDGMLYEDAERLHPAVYQEWMAHPTRVQFPEGESFTTFKTRVLGAFTRIVAQHQGETLAIFSHGGINRTILASLLKMQDEDIFRLDQTYACINRVEFIGEFPIVRCLNYVLA